MEQLAVVPSPRNHFRKMRQDFDSILGILIANLTQFIRLEGNFFYRQNCRRTVDILFRQMERGRANDKMLPDFDATRIDSFATKKQRVAGGRQATQLNVPRPNIELHMLPRNQGIPRNRDVCSFTADDIMSTAF